jgi:uncharacterized surface protein with fasciclin (FAS1) repeats
MKTPRLFHFTRRTLGSGISGRRSMRICCCRRTCNESSTMHRLPLSTLNSLIVAADLQGALDAAGPFTVFAPSNDALKAVPAAVLNDVSKDPAKLKNLLTYHVVPAAAMAKDVKNRQTSRH